MNVNSKIIVIWLLCLVLFSDKVCAFSNDVRITKENALAFGIEVQYSVNNINGNFFEISISKKLFDKLEADVQPLNLVYLMRDSSAKYQLVSWINLNNQIRENGRFTFFLQSGRNEQQPLKCAISDGLTRLYMIELSSWEKSEEEKNLRANAATRGGQTQKIKIPDSD